MLKKAAVLLVGLALCAPAMAKTHHHHHKHHKYNNRVVYVVERPVFVEPVMVGRSGMVMGDVTVVRYPNGYRQYYRYPRMYLYY